MTLQQCPPDDPRHNRNGESLSLGYSFFMTTLAAIGVIVFFCLVVFAIVVRKTRKALTFILLCAAGAEAITWLHFRFG